MSEDSSVQVKAAAFFSQYPKRQYPKGQIIVFADEHPSNIFYLAEGKVRQYNLSYRDDEITLNVFKPHAFFAMGWAINKSKNQFFFKAETNSSLHVVPAKDALKFLKDNPDVMLDLLSRLYRGMDGLLGRMSQLMAGTARTRLIYELLIEAERFGTKSGQSIVLSINETDLASRTGLSRETISREISKLRGENVAHVEAGSIKITDITKLSDKLSNNYTGKD